MVVPGCPASVDVHEHYYWVNGRYEKDVHVVVPDESLSTEEYMALWGWLREEYGDGWEVVGTPS